MTMMAAGGNDLQLLLLKYLIKIHSCILQRQHGDRGRADQCCESAPPAGAVFLMGHAGVGDIHCRYE